MQNGSTVLVKLLDFVGDCKYSRGSFEMAKHIYLKRI